MTARSPQLRKLLDAGHVCVYLVAGLVAVNLVLFATMRHVFQTPGYRDVAGLRDLIPGALAVNVLATTLVIFFRWRFQWRLRFESVLALEGLVSLLPFVLVRALRVPEAGYRLGVFGAVYALFVYLHAGLLTVYGLSNATAEGQYRRQMKSLCAWVFAASLLVYAAMTPWVKIACSPTADEPHYLLLTHSLVFDHDFDLANNYAHGNYRNFYPLDIPSWDHHSVTNVRGKELPVHDVGISILVIPGYALAGRLGAMFELDVFGALLALGIFVLGIELGASPGGGLASWSLFAFTSPVAMYTSQIYPEIVGAGLITWAVVAHIRFTQSRKSRYLWLAASALALLPWFSIRYWVLLGPILVIIALHLVVAGGFPRLAVLKPLAVVVVPLLVSVGFFSAFDLHLYQTPIPNAGYVLLLRPRPSLIGPHLLPGLPGLLFDRAFGLLTTAPVYLLAIAGAWVLCRRAPWRGALIVLPILAYMLFAAVNRFWYGGWAPPPRYLVTGVAILAPVAALVLSRRTPRPLLALITTWSLFISIGYTAFPLTRYTYWSVNSGALSEFLSRTIGFRFGSVFPSFIRANRSDYLLCLFWLAATLVCLWVLVRTAPAAWPAEEPNMEAQPHPQAAVLH